MGFTQTAYIEVRENEHAPWQCLCLYRKDGDDFIPIAPYRGCLDFFTSSAIGTVRGLPMDVSKEVNEYCAKSNLAEFGNSTWYTVRELELMAEVCSCYVDPLIKTIDTIANIDDKEVLYYCQELILDYKNEIEPFKIFLKDIEKVLEEYGYYDHIAYDNLRVIIWRV